MLRYVGQQFVKFDNIILLKSAILLMKNSTANSVYAPHIALFAVQLMFGSSAVIGKIALQTFPAFAIVGFRVTGGAPAFCFLLALKGNFRLEKPAHYLHFAGFSLLGIVFNHLLFFKGLSLTTAANTSLLAVTIPIFAIIISAILGYDKLTRRKIFGVLLATIGVIYLIDPAKASFSSDATIGNILIILNSLSYAVYIVVSKKLVSYYGALKSIAWIFLPATLINIPIGFFSFQTVEIGQTTLTAWAALTAVVVFPTILAYYWNAWALARITPGIVAVYTYLQPLFGFTFAILFLGEQFTLRLILSALLILGGVFLVTRQRLIETR